MIRVLSILIVSILALVSTPASAQNVDTRFGKNRVQYHDDFKKWDKYETENFIIFWYGKAKNVAKAVVPMAELFHDEVQAVVEHRMNDKIQILIYTDLSDLNQSNIGNDDTWTSKSGETKIVGSKMFVYFNGNHQDLRDQLKEGIASVYLASMLFGASFQEFVQNAVLLNLPEWFKDGIVSYSSSAWNTYIEDELRDVLENNEKYYDFNKLSEDHPRVAGHSMWYFISQYYSPTAIPNLLYLTKISRDLDESFVYVLSENKKTVFSEWSGFYKEYYQAEKGRYVSPSEEAEVDLKNKDYVPISQMRFSPDGKSLAYVYNNIGQYRIQIRDLETGKEKTIFKYGYKNSVQETDYNYPLITWHPDNKTLSFAYEHRDAIKIRKLDVETGNHAEQLVPEEFQRIYSMDYLDSIHYIFSANTDGYADLYKYDSDFRTQERITNDFYDDLDATVTTIDGKKGILFSSNRQSDLIVDMDLDTILPLENFDLFFYDLQEGNKSIDRITDTESHSERYPFITGKEGYITYLSHKSGIKNTYVLDLITGRSYSVSNLDRNIIRHHSSAVDNKYIYTLYRDGAYKIFLEEKAWSNAVPASSTALQRSRQPEEVLIPFVQEEKEEEVVEDGFLFQAEYDDPLVVPDIADNKNKPVLFREFLESRSYDKSDRPIEALKTPRITASRLAFRVDNFTTKVDNEVLFEGLESYTGDPNQLDVNPTGILLKATIKDLLEDYVFEGGVRIPTAFNGTEYFLVFDDKKKLIDRRYAFYRRVTTDQVDDTVFPAIQTKKNTLIGLYQLKYPMDVYRSIRATTSLRLDRFYTQSVDEESFNSPLINDKRLSLKLEYVYDNTIDIDENIKHGTRYKFFVEGINKFDFQVVDGFKVDPTTAYTFLFGFDFRHYIPFLKYGIIALRTAGVSSYGSEKIMFHLGGTNGWVFQQFDDTTPIPEDQAFAYKSPASQMRGFKYNVRNGSSFALINTEVRLPIFKYLLGRNIKSAMIRNFQIVGFFDAGSAWHGLTPYSDDNPLNSQVFTNPPVVEVEVNYFRDPLVMGYGYGIRTKLLGYFIKLDYAYGIETRRVNDGIFYFSLGRDF